MTLTQAINARHSVRQYTGRPLAPDVIAQLQGQITDCNRESGLHIQLVTDEPAAFSGFMARYGKFSGVRNYFALIGRRGPELEEKCGYYGQHLVLTAQSLGLNTCWVALTYSRVKAAFTVSRGEKLCAVIALGYGETQGTAHKSKPASEVSPDYGTAPEWFRRGVDAALLAPTAINQQKFRFTLRESRVLAEPGSGFYTKVDLGIAKYHFELAAGQDSFTWA